MNLERDARVTAFLDSITARILLRRKASEIRREFLAHIEDAAAASIQKGLTEDQAIETALSGLGNPARIALQLNRVHRPLLALPFLRAVAILVAAILCHLFVFGGHLGQLAHGEAFSVTVLVPLLLALLGSDKARSLAALRSLFLPGASLTGTERAQAQAFFGLFSRQAQRLTVVLAAVSLLGVGACLKDPSMIGRWVALGFLGYFYGLVFGVLLAGAYSTGLEEYKEPRLAGLIIQGLAPALVLLWLIRIISQLSHPAVFSRLAMTAIPFLVSIG